MKGRLFLALFALPFAGVGAWMAVSLGHMALEVREMRGWDAVPARILTGGYTAHSGDDATTYEAWATYQYAYDGRVFTGQRVQLAGGADNIGDYQQSLGRRLETAASRHAPVTVYVDPSNPAQSIVDRDLRWALVGFKAIFLLVFGGVGFGMLAWAIRAPAERDATLAEFAASPWLLNPAWQTATIRSGSRAMMWGTWLFAIFWNLVSAPLPFLLYDEVSNKQNYLALVGLLFPVVGAGLLVWAVRRTLEWRRFGATPVVLDPFPGSIGGHVGGTIETRIPFDGAHRFRLKLSNIHSYETGSGDNRSRSERVLWQDELLAHAAQAPQGTRLSFRFDVPEGLTASDAQPSGDAYDLWRLHLTADLPGADFDRSFDIPVYPTARRSEKLDERGAAAPAAVQDRHYEQAARSRMRIQQDGFGKTLLYPMGQQVTANAAGILVGGTFAAAGAWLAIVEGHPVFGGVFASVGGLVFVLAIYMLFKSLEVVVSGDTIESVRYWLGFVVSRRSLRRGDFLRFEKRSNMQAKSGADTTNYYKICGVGRSGAEVVLGENFAGEAEARAAVAVLSKELGLREAAVVGANGLDPSMFDRRSAASS